MQKAIVVIAKLRATRPKGPRIDMECGTVAFIFPNVCDDRSPLAFGVAPANAGDMTKVPKAWGFGPSLC